MCYDRLILASIITSRRLIPDPTSLPVSLAFELIINVSLVPSKNNAVYFEKYLSSFTNALAELILSIESDLSGSITIILFLPN